MNSSAINRSGEFGQIVENLSSAAFLVRQPTPQKRIANDFNWTAKQIYDQCNKISKDLFQTLDIIENNFYLTNSVVRCNNIFSLVRENLDSVEKNIGSLEDIQIRLVYLGNQQKQYCSNVVLYLREKHDSLQRELKFRLEHYSETLKFRQNRMQLYSVENTSMIGPPQALQQTSILMGEDKEYRAQMMMDVNEGHQAQRNDLADIESTVVHIGEMLRTIAVAVEQQKESVERIDANVENVTANVDSAYSELLKNFRSYTSRRSLTMKVMAVLVMSFVFSVLVL